MSVSNSSNAFIDLVAGNTSYSGVRFGDTDDSITGGLYFNHNGNSLSLFGHDNTERFTIDSNGEVTIQGDAKKLIFGASADSDMAHYADGQFAFRNTDSQGFTFYTGSGPTERMRIDSSGNVGIGVVPNTSWSSGWTVLQLGATGFVGQFQSGATDVTALGSNVWSDGSYKYIETDEAAMIKLQDGTMIFDVAPSGTADNAISFTTAMTINNSGKVGIGTTSPSSPLHITGNATTTDLATRGVHLHDTSTVNEDILPITFTFTSTANRARAGIGGISRSADAVAGYGGAIGFYTRAAADASALSSSDERMRITESGNLGIGLTAPTSSLHVLKNAGGEQTVANFSAHNYGDAAATYIQIGTEYTDGSSRIGSINNGDGGGGNTSALVFETHDSSSGSLTERMRIRHDGRVNIPNAYTETTGNSANLFVDTDGRLIRATSSERYKNTITDATHGLTELLTLRPVTYKGNNDGDTVFGGLIAEEVHDAGLTEFVQYNTDNEPDALAYGNMVSICIKAIQELSAKVTTLETEKTTLEARILALETA
jgi:hypothetical protein